MNNDLHLNFNVKNEIAYLAKNIIKFLEGYITYN
jgi:hypothetical protein